MSDLSEEWKKLRQELGIFMCKLDNATNRAITTDEQRKKVYDTAFEAGWQNGRNDLWDNIDDYFMMTIDNTERQKLAKEMEHTAVSCLEVLSNTATLLPDTFTTRLTTYHEACKNRENQISPGDECYYLLSGDGPYSRFIITKIYDGKKEKFFDGIYHDGRTISTGSLRLVTKTGNYYPIMNSLLSPFDEPGDNA